MVIKQLMHPLLLSCSYDSLFLALKLEQRLENKTMIKIRGSIQHAVTFQHAVMFKHLLIWVMSSSIRPVAHMPDHIPV